MAPRSKQVACRLLDDAVRSIEDEAAVERITFTKKCTNILEDYALGGMTPPPTGRPPRIRKKAKKLTEAKTKIQETDDVDRGYIP